MGVLYVAADLNATDRPSNALNIDGEFWSDPGFASGKMSGRRTKIALGPNANAVVVVDIDASDNKMNDGNTSGSALVSVTISGTVQAIRPVSSLTLQGYVGSSFVGSTFLGSMSAVQTKSFTITGILSTASGRCRVDMRFLEAGSKSQGVVNER